MFKKTPNRPSISISLKKTTQGYRVVPNQSYQLFTSKKIIRSIYRPDMQMSNQNIQGSNNPNNLSSNTMIQPPIHVTIPAVSEWFSQQQVHEIQEQQFPQFFKQQTNRNIFSFSIKNINLYLYYRNTIITMWRENSKKYLSPSLCRKNLLGDVSSIMRIHAFLQNWGLINFPSKQHQKGKTIKTPQTLNCYICQISYSKIYYITQIQDCLFQICQNCYQNQLYPSCIEKEQFRRIYLQNHLSQLQKQMDRSQIIKLLQTMMNIPNLHSKDKDIWSIIQRQFPDHTKQQLLKIFLKLPLTNQMNSNIFQNYQDVLYIENQQIKKQIQSIQQPSIFENYCNPIQSSIAFNYFQWKLLQAKYNNQKNNINNQQKNNKNNQQKNHDNNKNSQQSKKQQINQTNLNQQQQKRLSILDNIFKSSQKHCKYLASDQQNKIRQLTNMLIQVVLSKLELKNLFISEYQKLILSEYQLCHNTVKNALADNLKHNCLVINKINQNQSKAHESANIEHANNVLAYQANQIHKINVPLQSIQ